MSKENGLKNLSFSAENSENALKEIIQSRMGAMMPYYIGATIIVGVSLIICFGIMIPILIGIQREKINVLMLYTQMKKKEVDQQVAKCTEYQQSIGLFYRDEDSDDQANFTPLGETLLYFLQRLLHKKTCKSTG